MKKIECIQILAENIYTPVGKSLSTLIDLLIDEVRAENDTASTEQFLSNKGKIEGYKDLKAYINRQVKNEGGP